MQPWMSLLYTFILLFFLSLVLLNEHWRITLAAETVAAVVCVFVRVPARGVRYISSVIIS